MYNFHTVRIFLLEVYHFKITIQTDINLTTKNHICDLTSELSATSTPDLVYANLASSVSFLKL